MKKLKSKNIDELEEKYATIVLTPIRFCKRYKPKFGHGTGLNLSEFQTLYRSDSFYSWFGLDSPLLYSAHKAAGGMTSIYRQIGIGCQKLFQQILIDKMGLNKIESSWGIKLLNPAPKLRSFLLMGE